MGGDFTFSPKRGGSLWIEILIHMKYIRPRGTKEILGCFPSSWETEGRIQIPGIIYIFSIFWNPTFYFYQNLTDVQDGSIYLVSQLVTTIGLSGKDDCLLRSLGTTVTLRHNRVAISTADHGHRLDTKDYHLWLQRWCWARGCRVGLPLSHLPQP